MLTVMNNNRAYHQKSCTFSAWPPGVSADGPLAYRHHDPRPVHELCKLADAMGGPASADRNPADLGPALKRGIDIVKRGEPVIIDVVMQPR
jgi:thiamine pyrophosphate-dependent acetolactate synthase large subunit-like protein